MYEVGDIVYIISNKQRQVIPAKIVEQVTYPHMSLGHMDEISAEKLAAIRENQKGQLP